MGKFSLFILFLVVIGNQVILECRANSSGSGETAISSSNNNNNGKDDSGQQSRFLISNLDRHQLMDQLAFGQNQGLNRVDDHSNVDLDKLDGLYRYELLPSSSSNTNLDSYTLLGRDNSRGLGPREFYRSQLDKKRAFRDGTEFGEDNNLLIRYLSGYQQPRANFWNAQKLRDMLLSGKLSKTGLDIDQLSQPMASSWPSYAANREKRRRICKADGNGVKNPSFCDGDVYFKASDYDLADVWDKVGRR